MQEHRRHRRMKVPLRVEISHPSFGSLQVEAGDMSDAGVFLLMDERYHLDPGENVIVRTLQLGVHGGESSIPLTMRVMRCNKTGMGLELVEEDQLDANAADPSLPSSTDG
jgi:hypothetical protein